MVNNGIALKRNAIARLLLLAAASICRAESVNFDDEALGGVPAGWMVAMTHTGGAPKWEVLKDDSAPSKPNVLAQVSTTALRDVFRLPSGIASASRTAQSQSNSRPCPAAWTRVPV